MTATTNATTSSDSQSHFYSPPVAPTQEIIYRQPCPLQKVLNYGGLKPLLTPPLSSTNGVHDGRS